MPSADFPEAVGPTMAMSGDSAEAFISETAAATRGPPVSPARSAPAANFQSPDAAKVSYGLSVAQALLPVQLSERRQSQHGSDCLCHQSFTGDNSKILMTQISSPRGTGRLVIAIGITQLNIRSFELRG